MSQQQAVTGMARRGGRSAPAGGRAIEAPPLAAPAMVRVKRLLLADRTATVIVVGAIVVALQIASIFAPAYIAPPPTLIVARMWTSLTVDPIQIAVTLARLAAALAFALVVGTVIGIAIGTIAWIRPYLRALVVIDTGISALSWMLLAAFWFKNPELRIFFIMAVLLIPFYALSVYDGIRAIPKDWVEMCESFRPSRMQVLHYLILPHIAAYVLGTTKTVVGYATRMVIFAELIGSAVGIGAQMGLAQANFDIAAVIGWTVLLVALNLFLQWAINRVEGYVLRWRPPVEVR
ncbi:MAG TPA: ABC transporter permease subunit [Hyphomicrobiales bacterium]|nr:ABC transporter permease subunit [Hyphomicrobiales bacterium]